MMKNIIFCITLATVALSACNGNRSKSTKNLNLSVSALSLSKTDNTIFAISSVTNSKNSVTTKEIVSTYLQLKNDFTEDNSTGAASAGKKLEAAFKNFDKSALTAAQKKTYEDVEADAREHTEHIGAT
jgi:Protein of unknown function (DUF3347)